MKRACVCNPELRREPRLRAAFSVGAHPSYAAACRLMVAVTALTLARCDRRNERQTPPQLPESGVCPRLGEPGEATGEVFAPQVGDYCLDPNGQIARYGKEASRSLDELCLHLLDGECALYRAYGVEAAKAARYLDRSGSAASVNVLLTRYASIEGAFGFFTQRVVGAADPGYDPPTPFEVAGVGGLSAGSAYVWRGAFVLELSYGNESLAPDQRESTAAAVLPPIASALGERLAAPSELPRAARVLPEQARLPLGILYQLADLLDVKGTGAGAFGYYARDGKRWRVLVFARLESESIEDLVSTFRKSRGHRAWKDPLPALESPFRYLALSDGVTTQWVFAQKDSTLIGVGDDALVLTSSMSNAVRDTLTLSDEAKQRELLSLIRTPLPP